MSEADMMRQNYIGYEYKDVKVENSRISMYLDGYECFGWSMDENRPENNEGEITELHLKRDRKILNKMELTRLQQHYEDCMTQIKILEQKKNQNATIAALSAGIIGTAFMAGAVFAVTANPPIIWLCVLLAIPGIIGWITPYFVFKKIRARSEEKIQPLIESKKNEIDEVCEKGYHLIHG